MFLVVVPTRAEHVPVSLARQVAANMLEVDSTELTLAKLQQGWANFYIFNADGAFVIVAADDCVPPVLAYSHDGAFTLRPDMVSVVEWLDDYEAEIAALVAYGARPTEPIRRQWAELTSSHRDQRPDRVGATAVHPLVQTTWDQTRYYNDLCPYDSASSTRAVTGCVATAMAQVMKYWNHPDVGRQRASYYDQNYGYQSARFDTTHYDWDSMPNSLNYRSTDRQVDAVATLMQHCGVAVEMAYGTSTVGGSSSATYTFYDWSYHSCEYALKRYFRYSSTLVPLAMEDYTPAEWQAILRRELDAGRPMLYTGRDTTTGHAFVCDGYDTASLFHFNWGWGGWCDGYYRIGALNPAPGGTGGNATYTFNLANSAIIGIRPAADNQPQVHVEASTNNAAYGNVIGAGTYARYVDTVTLLATATDSCRFLQWSDGAKINPRCFLASDSVSLTAIFAPLRADTVGYASGSHITSYGGNGQVWWATRLPAVAMNPSRTLTQVHVYLPTAGQYEVKVHRGGSAAPGGMALTQTYITTLDNSWHTITLSYPIALDYNMPIWIVLGSSQVPYPAACTHYAGNPDGLWASFGSNSNWQKLSTHYSWMIEAYLSDTTADYTLEARSANDQQGTVAGGGTYHYNTATTITATPAPGFRFVQWNDGAAQNPRTLTVLANAEYVATFDRRPFGVEASPAISGQGSVSGSGNYYYGDMATLVATPAEGYTFSHWSNGSTDNPYRFAVTDDVVLRAYFESQNAIAQPWPDDVGVTVNGLEVSVVGTAQATLTDVCGRQIAPSAAGANQARFALPSAGIYLLRLATGQVRKIVAI